MRHHMRTLVVLVVLLSLPVACSRSSRDGRVGQASTAPTVKASATPIADHPPVTATGVVAGFDRASGILVFKDGRMVKLTDQSKLLRASDGATGLRPGEQVIAQNALPVAVESASPTKAKGKRQRMATVASVDEKNQLVRLTDGSAVRVTPSTKMHKGTEGAAMVLAELRPGDELVIVIADGAPKAAAGAVATSAPSALPRDVSAATSTPTDADEVMVFRDVQAP